WVDAHGSPPANAVKEMLAGHGMQGKRIGIQLETFGLLPRAAAELHEALDGWCELVDASDLVLQLRHVKSPQELDYLRKAGEIVDQAQAAAIETTRAGAFEGDVIAAVYGA